jgi:Na+-transporting NADH:ubiquinone oxidoreductase subunit NqrF
MTALEVVLAIVGFTVTALVVVGMILITPRGAIDLHDPDANDPQ